MSQNLKVSFSNDSQAGTFSVDLFEKVCDDGVVTILDLVWLLEAPGSATRL